MIDIAYSSLHETDFIALDDGSYSSFLDNIGWKGT